MVRRVGLIAALCALITAGTAQAATTVDVGNNSQNKFTPPSVTISTGDTVHWTWDGSDHSVTSGSNGNADGQFDSGIQNSGSSFDHTFTAPGTYHYFCQVHFAEGMVGTITVVAKPVASFTTSPAAPVAGHSVTFDGSASTAPSGSKIVSYVWNFGDNTPPVTTATPTTTHGYSVAGSFSASLTVVDDEQPPQSSTTATHTIKVAVDRPTARFTAKPATSTPGKAVTFDGSASSDSDGDKITSYQWNFGDGATLTSASPSTTHVYNAVGTFRSTLTVLDAQGNPSTTVKHTVTVQPAPGKPVGRFSFSPAHPVTGSSVTFDASKSTDPNGFAIVNYRWSFGDSTPLTTPSPTPTHVYSKPGTYIVRLVVTDSKGLKSAAVAEKVVVGTPAAPVISGLHAGVCKHAGGRCTRRGIRVSFTLSAAGHVTLMVRRRHHHRLLRNRGVNVGAGNIVVYLRLGHLKRARYVLAASVSGGNGTTARFRVRR